MQEKIIAKLWNDFKDVPVDENDCIDIEWHRWPKGTEKMLQLLEKTYVQNVWEYK